MFQKSNRLRNNKEIQKTLRKGAGFRTPFFNVKFLKSDEKFKITVIVSKKISKLAVKRNRLKRIFRASIKNVLKKKWIEDKLLWKFVFFPFETALDKQSSEIDEFIEKFFFKLDKNFLKK